MNIVEFHRNIERLWDQIEEQVDAQDCDADCDRQSSVFTVTFNDRSQIVVNKQEPMLELWLASRLGGLHFAFKNGQWVDGNGRLFKDCLAEAFAAYGEPIKFD